MCTSSQLPVLDYGKCETDLDAFATELFNAANQWGFFVLTGSRIDAEPIFELSRNFFQLPLEEKAEKIVNERLVGYDGKTKTTFAASEGVSFGTTPGGIMESDNLPSWWPMSRRETIEAFKSQCYDLSISLMSCFAVRLGLKPNYFLESHLHKDPGNTLKLIRYPPVGADDDGSIPRLSEHTDWGSVTFVFTKKEGLEIRDLHGNWCRVPLVDGGIVVNVGDALSLWTGKALKSTMHRITWENLPADEDRYSIAYFTNPNFEAVLNNLNPATGEDTAPVTYRDYYNIRQRLTFGSLTDAASGNKIFPAIDPEKLEAVRRLEVANAGALHSHALTA